MALQILQQPGTISFAGDPIIVKARTTLTGKAFLRIELECKVDIIATSVYGTSMENYSYMVGEDGIATLNIGKTVQSALERYNRQEVDELGIEQEMYKASFKLSYKEVYLDGIQEVVGDTVQSEPYTAIIGSLTEYERFAVKNSDTAALIGTGRILSRKPDEETVARGEVVYVPAVVDDAPTISCYAIQGENTRHILTNTGASLIPGSMAIDTSVFTVGEFKIQLGHGTGESRKRIVPETLDMRHFIFLNGFGLLESITAVTRESLTYNIDSETYVVAKDITYKGNTAVLTYSDAPQATLKMSSGYVGREWADWWMNEFVTTRRAWMKVDGRFLPVSIVPEEKNQLYDRSKPGLMAVNFNVRYSFAGGTMNSFVR